MTVYNELGVPAVNFDMEIYGYQIGTLDKGGSIRCHVKRLPLPIGRYRVAAAIYQIGIGIADHIPNALTFNVESSTFFDTGRTPRVKFSTCMVSHEWEHLPWQ
jgi:hypothetical protein